MIRKYTGSDLESIIKIWLDASVLAHDFVDRNFWQAKADDMRKIYISKSETWVYLEDNRILGFFSLFEDTLAALFVSPNSHNKGIKGEISLQIAAGAKIHPDDWKVGILKRIDYFLRSGIIWFGFLKGE